MSTEARLSRTNGQSRPPDDAQAVRQIEARRRAEFRRRVAEPVLEVPHSADPDRGAHVNRWLRQADGIACGVVLGERDLQTRDHTADAHQPVAEHDAVAARELRLTLDQNSQAGLGFKSLSNNPALTQI